MIHIVFETANIAVLQQAIELDETIQGTILEIKDDYAVGPLGDIYATEGYQLRRDWWKSLLEFSPYTEQLDLVDDKLTVHHLLKQLDEEPDTEVWIWMAQNAHDVCGYYWLMSQLKDYQGRVQVLYLNNLPFINEKGQIFYPSYLHEIQPKEFLKAKRLARPITLSEFEVDPDEWKKHCQESAMVRFLEGGKKIIGKEVVYPHTVTVPNAAIDLMGKLLKKNPNERIQMKMVLNHPFFSDIDLTKLLEKKLKLPFIPN